MMGTDEPFFFQQTPYKKREKRLKKHPDDLPQDLRFAHLNPRVAAYLASKEKENQRDDPLFNDGLGSKSLLPQISQTVSLLKSKLDSFLNDEDQLRYNFQEAKLRAESVLAQLERLLIFFEGTRITLPRALQDELAAQYKHLIFHVVYVKREWQNPSNKAVYFARKAQEEMQRQRLEEALKHPTPSLEIPTSQSNQRASAALEEDGRESSVDGKASSRGKSKLSRNNTALDDPMSDRKSTKLSMKPDGKDKPLESHKSRQRLDKYRASLASNDYKPTGGADRSGTTWSK